MGLKKSLYMAKQRGYSSKNTIEISQKKGTGLTKSIMSLDQALQCEGNNAFAGFPFGVLIKQSSVR